MSGSGGQGGVSGSGPVVEPTVRPAVVADIPAWARLRSKLWPESTEAEHAQELPGWLAEPDSCSLVAVVGDEVVGFVEGRLRSHADGCATSPVGYLEGWYVAPEWRRGGVGSALVAGLEAWARERGCAELASDTGPDNEVSLSAHRRLGFLEVDLAVRFRKLVAEDGPVGAPDPPSVRPPAGPPARPPARGTP